MPELHPLRGHSPLPARPRRPAQPPPVEPEDRFSSDSGSHWAPARYFMTGLLAATALTGLAAQASQTTPPSLAQQTRTQLFLHGVEDIRSGKVPTPAYLGGSHPDWHDQNDHCYSIYFRVAIRQGLISEQQAEDLMQRMHQSPGDFLPQLFPQGTRDVPFQMHGERAEVKLGVIPAGHLISMDGGDHVMMSTGRLLPDGRHEVYSFKGGGPETPVWGDSIGYDPAAKIHKMTLEDELEALARDAQPLDQVHIVEGLSALNQ